MVDVAAVGVAGTTALRHRPASSWGADSTLDGEISHELALILARGTLRSRLRLAIVAGEAPGLGLGRVEKDLNHRGGSMAVV